jgi:ABC-type phosphate transport system substrate-binding protein
MRHSMCRYSCVSALVASLAGCGGGQTQPAEGTAGEGGRVQVNGAGATFPNPIYSKWFAEYNKLHPNVEINYQSIGSGGGIRQLLNQTVFFGATDGPMTDEQLKAAPSPIRH